MINFSLDKQLSVLLPSTNKALAEVLKNASPQELSMLAKHKDLGSLLNSIFQKSAQDPTQNATLLKLLQNNPTLKSLGSVTATLQNLAQLLAQEKMPLPLETTLKNLMDDIQNISEKELKSKLENSGVFLESKLKSSAQTPLQKERFGSDLKAVLLRTQEELANAASPKAQEILKQVDKLLLQIDYYQLSSHLANGSSLYLPYSWDALEDGNLTLKKGKDEHYFCDIELHLKEHGEIKLRLGLFHKNQLSININIQSQSLKENIKEHLGELKKGLLSVGVTPLEIRFVDEKKVDGYDIRSEDVAMGFEVKA